MDEDNLYKNLDEYLRIEGNLLLLAFLGLFCIIFFLGF